MNKLNIMGNVDHECYMALISDNNAIVTTDVEVIVDDELFWGNLFDKYNNDIRFNLYIKSYKKERPNDGS